MPNSPRSPLNHSHKASHPVPAIRNPHSTTTRKHRRSHATLLVPGLPRMSQLAHQSWDCSSCCTYSALVDLVYLGVEISHYRGYDAAFWFRR